MHDDGGRLRVLWAIKGLGPGGAERLLVSMATAADHETFAYRAAYVLSYKGHLAPELEALGVPVTALGARSTLDARWVPRLRQLIASWRPHVVHAHLPVVSSATRLIARSLPARNRPVVVTTEHNPVTSYAWPTRLVNAATARFSDAHLAVSNDARDSLPPRLRRRTEVIVHGVVPAEIERARLRAAEARAALGIADDELLVVTVANLRAQKDYPNLLAAARRVVDACPQVRFAAIGQGPEEQHVRQHHAELGLGDRFLLLGYQPEPLPIVAAADVFTLGSRWEGFPVALMEALALGLPVVATRVGGVPDAVRDGVEGRLVPPGDPDALAGALLEVLADGDRRAAMAAAAAERGRDFDIAHAIRRTEALYRALLAARG